MTTAPLCPGCGYPSLQRPPWIDGRASTEVCPCCGLQFGFADADARGERDHAFYEGWRECWKTQATPWWSSKVAAPKDWSGLDQLKAAFGGYCVEGKWLPEDWFDLTGSSDWEHSQFAAINAQVAVEVKEGHPLYGCDFELVAKSMARDDILLELRGGGWVVVHLTWGGPQEPPSPSTRFFDNAGELVTELELR